MRLLKFRSLAGASKEQTLEIIRTKSFYIPNLSDLNDPFDSNFPLDLDDEMHQLFLMKTLSEMDFDGGFAIYLATKESQNNRTKILDWLRGWEVRRKIRQKLIPSGGVVSFSKKEEVLTHPLMWAHYADSHKGICCEIESYSGIELREVEYIRHLPKINFLNINSENVNELCWQKGDMWSYEKEVRFIAADPNARRLPFPPASLKAIYFGVNSDFEDIKLIQSLVKEEGLMVEYGMMEPSTEANMLNVTPMGSVSEMLQKFKPTKQPNISKIKEVTKDVLLKTIYDFRDELRKK